MVSTLWQLQQEEHESNPHAIDFLNRPLEKSNVMVKNLILCLNQAYQPVHLVLKKDNLSSFANGHSHVLKKNREDFDENCKKMNELRRDPTGRLLHAMEFMVECLLLILKRITQAKVKGHDI